jgi:enoyl-CoA hydratase/carnithine racemase
MSNEDRVVWHVEADGVAVVELNRPDKRNALDGPMFGALARVGAELRRAPALRAVVLTGRGESFCAGLDMASFAEMQQGRGPADQAVDPTEMQPGGLTHLGQQTAWTWRQLPVPVIAALRGHALGGGLQIALGADVRIAHPDTKLSVREVHFGITPDMTGTYTMSRLARPDVALLLAATAELFDARRGFELGLVTQLSEAPLEAALTAARAMAAQSPDAIRGVKRLIYGGDGDAPGRQFALERETVLSLVGTPNQVEAVTAGFERRPAVFVDPEPAPSANGASR